VRRVGAGERSGGRRGLGSGASRRSDVGRRRGRRRGDGGSGGLASLGRDASLEIYKVFKDPGGIASTQLSQGLTISIAGDADGPLNSAADYICTNFCSRT
jgi:hypothetical protein